jgi:replicative DNA helicase
METTSSKSYTLPVRNARYAVDRARQEVVDSMKGDQVVLKTRWSNVNRMLMGGLRFNNIVLLAGASGAGKSFLLNMLHRDFMNTELNGSLIHPFKILHFNFEMSSADEILRSVSGQVELSYAEILSAFKPITSEEFHKIDRSLSSFTNDTIFYVEKPGNRYEIKETIYKFHEKFPEHKLVITLDHTLLVNYLDEKTEVELLAELGKMFIEIRKDLGSLIIMLGQLNDKIEDPRRREPALHYPTKTDIHGSKQMYHAADMVLVIHRPEMMNITTYGPRGYPTDGALFLHALKMRKGDIGLSRLRQNYAKGQIEEWTDNYGLT